jgi:hypothetical protein
MGAVAAKPRSGRSSGAAVVAATADDHDDDHHHDHDQDVDQTNQTAYHSLSARDVLDSLDSLVSSTSANNSDHDNDPAQKLKDSDLNDDLAHPMGLSTDEAEKRLRLYGRNGVCILVHVYIYIYMCVSLDFITYDGFCVM